MNNIFDEAIRVGKETNAKALKPCPFCGGKYAGLYQEKNADGKFIMYIECRNCGARGSVKRFPMVQFADIRNTWNDRTDDFLDEYIFRGGTLREWVEKIERGEIRAERHGHWICEDLQGGFGKITCSRCREEINVSPTRYENLKEYEKFCASCGARMDGE